MAEVVLTSTFDDTKKIVVPQGQKLDYIGMSDPKTGQPLWKSKSGKSQVYDKNSRGETVLRDASDTEVWLRKSQNKPLRGVVQGDPEIGEAQSASVRQAQRRLAEASPGQAFLQGLGGPAAALVEGGLVEGARQTRNDLEEAHPFLEGMGEAANFLFTLGGPALASKGAGLTLKALVGSSDDIVSAGLRDVAGELTGRKISETGLLGFAQNVGKKVTTSVSAGEVPGLGAKFAGGAARNALIDLPLSAQLTITDMVDGDVPATAEAFISRAGMDIMFGGFLELGLRGAARAATGGFLRKGAGAVADGALGKSPAKSNNTFTGNTVVSDVKSVVRSEVKGTLFSKLFGNSKVGNLIKRFGFRLDNRALRKRARNAASRNVSAARSGDDFIQAQAAVDAAQDLSLDSLHKAGPKKFETIIDKAAAGVGASADDIVAVTRPGANKAVRRVYTNAGRAGKSMEDYNSLYKNHRATDANGGVAGFRENFTEQINTGKLNYAGASKNLNAHVPPVLNRLQHILVDLGADNKTLSRFAAMEKSLQGVKNPAKVSNVLIRETVDLMDLTRRGKKGQLLMPLAEAWEKEIGQFLRDETIWGAGAKQHDSLLSAVDDLVDSQSRGANNLDDLLFRNGVTPDDVAEALKGDLKRVANIPESAAYRSREAMGVARNSMNELLETGVINKKAHTKIVSKIDKATKNLDDIIADTDTIVGINNLAAKQGVDGLSGSLGLSDAADVSATAPSAVEALTVAGESALHMVSRAAHFLGEVEKAFTSTGAIAGAQTLGLVAYRSAGEEDKRNFYSNLEQMLNELDDPMTMQSQLTLSLERLQAGHPELAANVGESAVNQAYYLIDSLPRYPHDFFDNAAFDASMTDVDSLAEKYFVIEEPETAYYAIANNTLTEDMVQAMQAARPNLLAFMQSELANLVATTDKPIPYQSRLSIARFLGDGVEPTLEAGFVMSLQSTSAQTQAQEQATRQPSQRKSQIAEQLQTTPSRIADF